MTQQKEAKTILAQDPAQTGPGRVRPDPAAPPEEPIIPPPPAQGLPAWMDPNSKPALLIKQLDKRYLEVMDVLRQAGRPDFPGTPPRWPLIEKMKNLQGVFATEYNQRTAELEAIKAAVNYSDGRIEKYVQGTFDLVAKARSELRKEIGQPARHDVGVLRALPVEDPELTAEATKKFEVALEALDLIVRYVGEEVFIREAQIEEWVKTVRALGPPPRNETWPWVEHRERANRVVRQLPALKKGPVPAAKALEAAMRAGNGLVIGGYPHDPAAKQLLLANMDQLVKAGAGALFIEIPSIRQGWIDEFYADPSKAAQQKLADRLATELIDGSGEGLAEVIAAFKSKGVKTYAFDTTIRSPQGSLGDWLPLSSPYMAGVVAAKTPPGQKPVILVSSALSNAVGGIEGFRPDLISVDVNPSYPADYNYKPPPAGKAAISPWDGRYRPLTGDVSEPFRYNENSTVVVTSP